MILGISRTSGVPHPKDQGIQVAGWVLQVGGDVNNLADGVTSLGQWGIWKEEYFPCFTSCIPRASCCLSYQFIASLVVWIWPIAGLYHTPWQDLKNCQLQFLQKPKDTRHWSLPGLTRMLDLRLSKPTTFSAWNPHEMGQAIYTNLNSSWRIMLKSSTRILHKAFCCRVLRVHCPGGLETRTS